MNEPNMQRLQKDSEPVGVKLNCQPKVPDIFARKGEIKSELIYAHDQNPALALKPTQPSILQDLLGKIPVAEFFEKVYLRSRFVCRGGCRHLLHLCNSQIFQYVLSQSVGNLTRPSKHAYRGSSAIIVSQDDKAVPSSPRGYTTFIGNAQRTHPELAKLAAAFFADLNAKAEVVLFRSPARRAGLDWHTDPVEGFVLQTVGSKKWDLSNNTYRDPWLRGRSPWLFRASPTGIEPHPDAVNDEMSVILEAGDWLYFPKDCRHRTRAIKKSFSLTVAIQELEEQVLRGLSHWRQKFPAPPSSLSQEQRRCYYLECCTAMGKELAQRLSDVSFIDEFLTRRGQPGIHEPEVSGSRRPSLIPVKKTHRRPGR